MRRHSDRRGMTLIEILLALIVMVLGVVGILALFPPALQSSTESMEETNAAIIGESVAQALVNSIRFAFFNPATSQWEVTLAHDFKLGSLPIYKFTLPRLPLNPGEAEWKHFPGSTAPGTLDVGGSVPPMIEDDNRLFNLGGDGWVSATVNNVQLVNDPTDAYKQFGFSFDVRKVHTLRYLENKPNPSTGQNYTKAQLDALEKLFEFRIHIFRLGSQAGSFGSGGTTTTTAGADFRRLVATVTKEIASK